MALCKIPHQMKLGNSSRKIREFFKEQIMKILLLNNVIMLENPKTNILNTDNKLFDHLFIRSCVRIYFVFLQVWIEFLQQSF